MRNQGLIIFILFFSCRMFSQTTIQAGNVSGTWTKAGSPYKIMGEITIAKGSTLVLEPGTVLEFNGNFGLTVEGILNSQGVKGDSIIFKGSNSNVWSGIFYKNNYQIDTIRFNFCRFEDIASGYKFDFVNYGISFRNCSPVIIKNTSFYFFKKKYSTSRLYLFKKKLYSNR